MEDTLPPCPECAGEYTYEMGALMVCPSCTHEWAPTDSAGEDLGVVKDAVGNILADGDTVTVVKDAQGEGQSDRHQVRYESSQHPSCSGCW